MEGMAKPGAGRRVMVAAVVVMAEVELQAAVASGKEATKEEVEMESSQDPTQVVAPAWDPCQYAAVAGIEAAVPAQEWGTVRVEAMIAREQGLDRKAYPLASVLLEEKARS
mmetsp:Transcript_1096/g.3866  ORF Transcript_1096/g.3866 Transcript_1096/m.3866 type:complete len:111 (+) Transcript_1096:1255-1587(+)